MYMSIPISQFIHHPSLLIAISLFSVSMMFILYKKKISHSMGYEVVSPSGFDLKLPNN